MLNWVTIFTPRAKNNLTTLSIGLQISSLLQKYDQLGLCLILIYKNSYNSLYIYIYV